MGRIFRPGFQAVAIKEQDIDAIISMKDPKAAMVYLCAVRFGDRAVLRRAFGNRGDGVPLRRR